MSRYQASATLTGALLANKGTAAPSNSLAGLFDDLPRQQPPPAENPQRTSPEVSGPKLRSATVNRVKLSLRLGPAQHLRLKLAAAHLGMSSQKLLMAALNEYLERHRDHIAEGDCHCLRKTAGSQSADRD